MNARGYGAYSEVNTAGATIETTPVAMAGPSFDPSTSTNTQIVLTWAALTGVNAGGSSVSITSYDLQWDQGTSTWQSLTSTTGSVTTYTVTALTGGTTYQFKIAATNKYGTGPYSSAVSIVAAQAPAQPAAPTVTIDSIYVKIAWT